MFVLALSVASTSENFKLMDKHSIAYLVSRFLYCLVTIIWGCSLLSIMNLDVIEIIIHTFDFGFKSWNLILWLISFFG